MLGVYRRIGIEVSGIRVLILAGHSYKSQLALLVRAHTAQESHVSESGRGFLHQESVRAQAAHLQSGGSVWQAFPLGLALEQSGVWSQSNTSLFTEQILHVPLCERVSTRARGAFPELERLLCQDCSSSI